MGSVHKIGEAYVDIGTRMDSFNRGMVNADSKTKQLNMSFSKLATTSAVVSAALYAGYKVFISPASDAIETNNKFLVTFKDVKVEAEYMAKSLKKNYGLAQDESEKLLSNTGDLLTGFGLAGSEALNLSNQVQVLAADLASFTNIEGGVTRASEALTKALLGEREMTKALGIVISEKAIQEKLAAKGQEKLTGNALLQAKAYATLAIATEQSKNAIGDYARSAGSTANVERKFASAIRDLRVEIGKGLLPVYTEFVKTLADSEIILPGIVAMFKIIGAVIGALAKAITLAIQGIEDIGKSIKAKNRIREIKQLDNAIQGYIKTQNRYAKGSDAWEAWEQKIKKTKIELIKFRIEQAKFEASSHAKYVEYVSKKYDRIKESLKGALTGQIAGRKATANDIKIQKVFTEASNKQFIQAQTVYRQKQKNIKLLEEELKSLLLVNKEKEKENAKSSPTSIDSNYIKERAKFFARIDKMASESSLTQIQIYEKQKNDELSKLDKFTSEAEKREEQYHKRRAAIAEFYDTEINDKRKETAIAYMSFANELLAGMSEIMNMDTQNKITNIDNEQQRKLDAIQKTYDAEAKAISDSSTSEKVKAAKLKALDEKRAREEKKINEKADKEKAKINRKAAQREKATKIMQTIISTAAAIMQGYAQLGPIGGSIAAVIMTALGAAQVAMIARQPLPVAAEGGFFDTPYIGGEAGAEMAFPLSGVQGKKAMGLMTASLIDSITNKHKGQEPAIEQEPSVIRNIVYLDSDVIYDKVSQGTQDGKIIIDSRSIV